MNIEQNTAYYRISAQQAASECNWAIAAQQLAKAIEFYPAGGGALATLDLKRMNERLASYRQFAGQAAA